MLSHLTNIQQTVHADITVTQGNYKGTDIALAQSGIGKVNATICTQMMIDIYKPEKLVFSGVAGGLLPNLSVGDMVIASHLIQFDVDLTAFGRRHGELPDTDRMIQSDPDMVQAAADAFDKAFDGTDETPNLMIGTVVSGDRFVKDSETLKWLQREFGAFATEMEGAALGYTCDMSSVPFVIIRGISDGAGESAEVDFEANLSAVCRNGYRLLQAYIPTFG